MTTDLQKMFLSGKIEQPKQEKQPIPLGNLTAAQSMFLGQTPTSMDFSRAKTTTQQEPYPDEFRAMPEYTPQEIFQSIRTMPKNIASDALSFLKSIPSIVKMLTSPRVLWKNVLDPDYYERLQEIGGEDVDIIEWGQNLLSSVPAAGRTVLTRMILPSLRKTYEAATAIVMPAIGRGEIPDPISLISTAWKNRDELNTLGYSEWFEKQLAETKATGGASSFWRTFQRYTDHPLFSIWEDISNIYLVAGVAKKGIELPLKLSGVIKHPTAYLDDLGRMPVKGYELVKELPMEYVDDMTTLVLQPITGLKSYPYKLDMFQKTLMTLPKETVKMVWKGFSSNPVVNQMLRHINQDKAGRVIKGFFHDVVKKLKRKEQIITDVTTDMETYGLQLSENQMAIASTLAQIDDDTYRGMMRYLETYPQKFEKTFGNIVKNINKNLPKGKGVSIADVADFYENTLPVAKSFMQEVADISPFSQQAYVKSVGRYSNDVIKKVVQRINSADIEYAILGKENFITKSVRNTGFVEKLFNRISGAWDETKDFKAFIRDTAQSKGYDIGIAPPKFEKMLRTSDEAIQYASKIKAWTNTWTQLPDDIKLYTGIPIDEMTDVIRKTHGEFGILKPADIVKHFQKIKKGIIKSDKQSLSFYTELSKRSLEEAIDGTPYLLDDIGVKWDYKLGEYIGKKGAYTKERLQQLYDDISPQIRKHWNKIDKQKFVARYGKGKGAAYRGFIKEAYGDIPSTYYQALDLMEKSYDYNLIRKLSNVKIKQQAIDIAENLLFREAETITGIPRNHLKSFGFKPSYVPHRSADMLRKFREVWTPRLKETIPSALHRRGVGAYKITETPKAIVQSLAEQTYDDLDKVFQGLLENEYGKLLRPKFEKDLAISGKLLEAPRTYLGKELPDIFTLPEDFVRASWNKNIVIPKVISKSLAWMTAKNQPKWLGFIFDATSVPRRLWIKSVLGVPRLATNNTMGNVLLYALSGGDVKNVYKAIKIYFEYRKKAVAMGDGSMKTTLSLLTKDYGETLLSGFTKRGRLVAGSMEKMDDVGFLTNAIGKMSETMPKAAEFSKKVNKTLKFAEYYGFDWMFDKVMDVSGTSEAIFRLAAGLDKVPLSANLAKLWKINPSLYDDIVNHIDKFLFNYWKLTPVENIILRRAIPFYAWHKNIAKLALTLPFDEPLRFHIVRYLGATMEDAYWSSIAEEKGWDLTGEEAKNLIPKYMQQRYKLPEGLVGFAKKLGFTDKDTDLWISIKGFNPFADVSVEMEDMLSKIDPMIASGIEALTGVSLWKQREYITPYEETPTGIKEKRPTFFQIYATKFPQVQLARNLVTAASSNIYGQPFLDKYGRPLYKKNRWAELLKMTGVNLSQMELNQIWSDELKRQQKARKIMEKEEKKLGLYKKHHKPSISSIKSWMQNLIKGSSVDTTEIGITDIQKLFLYGEEGK